jgi:hypothetical protein
VRCYEQTHGASVAALMVEVMQECGDNHPSLHIIMHLTINRVSPQARWLGQAEFLAVVGIFRRYCTFIIVTLNFEVLLTVGSDMCRFEPMGRPTTERHEYVWYWVK